MSIHLATRGKISGSAISIATAGKINPSLIEIITEIVRTFITKNRMLNFITRN